MGRISVSARSNPILNDLEIINSLISNSVTVSRGFEPSPFYQHVLIYNFNLYIYFMILFSLYSIKHYSLSDLETVVNC